jgi:homeobox-leucine zipper protein
MKFPDISFEYSSAPWQNQFATVFSSIVSRASTHEVLSTGVAGNYDGALQVVRL